MLEVCEEDKDLKDKLGRLSSGICRGSFMSPFGLKKTIFCDHFASSVAYKPIENFIFEKILPNYANTHTFSSFTGQQTNFFREESRQIVQESVNANPVIDVVLFTGHGVTGAVNKLVEILDLKNCVRKCLDEEKLLPVVFLGPYEHHSNMLPWRETGAIVVNICENASGEISVKDLHEKLIRYQKHPIKIGSFSAASNVTGIITSSKIQNQVCMLMHEYQGFAFWDFAAAAPYLDIDMNPVDFNSLRKDALHEPANGEGSYNFSAKDAIFISPHKFVGGINTPGILVVKKALLNGPIPSGENLGGGTVFFVNTDSHRFLTNRVLKEEGGTPDIIGCIRAGLAFKLKGNIGCDSIRRIERTIIKKVLTTLANAENIEILGHNKRCCDTDRLAVISFLIRYQENRKLFLHYNFVSALLNDLFGIQTRSGCMCAGPYAQRLLGVSSNIIARIEAELSENHKESELLRPGFTRLSFGYYLTEDELTFILNALLFIAEHGYKFLPLYRMILETGEFRHKSIVSKAIGRIWLKDSNLTLESEFSTPGEKPESQHKKGDLKNDHGFDNYFANCFKSVTDELILLSKQKLELNFDQAEAFTNGLRWFLTASDVQLTSQVNPGTEISQEAILEPQNYGRNLAVITTKDITPNASRLSGGKFRPRDANVIRASIKQVSNPELLRKSEICLSDHENAESKISLSDDDNEAIAPVSQDDSSQCVSNLCFVPRSTVGGIDLPERNVELVFPSLEERGADISFIKTSVPKKILRLVGKAFSDFSMIENGDRILLGLSGGKDSLALLFTLLHFQTVSPAKFKLACCTIDPLTESFNPAPLIPFLKRLNIEYYYIKTPIFENAKTGLNRNSICSYCARMKRGTLYNICNKYDFNKLALAQHLDDNVETLLMSMFHNGNLRSMKSKYRETTFEKIEVIRPFCYVREVDLKLFSYKAGLPVIFDNCPACFEKPKERRRMKKLLAREETYSSNIFNNLRKAIKPLMHEEVLLQLKELK